jgi:hypothetical protein
MRVFYNNKKQLSYLEHMVGLLQVLVQVGVRVRHHFHFGYGWCPQDEDSDFLLSENLRFLGLELDDALLGVVSFGIGGMVLDPGE